MQKLVQKNIVCW